MERNQWGPVPGRVGHAVPAPRWAPPAPRVEAPAGLGDVAELGEPWAAAAGHAAAAVASGWDGNAAVWTPWGYPPPVAYRAVPAPPAPQPALQQPRRVTAPRWLPTPPIGVAHT
jgi:hypothetical protein